MIVQKILTVACAVLAVGYPALVYFGVQSVSPKVFAAGLALVALVRFASQRRKWDAAQVGLLVVIIIYSAALALSGNSFFLRLYPVLISSVIGVAFLSSYWQQQSLIERMARLAGKEMTALACLYTRKLTLVWAVLLFANAAAALYVARFGTLQQWALYCGALSYAGFAIFFVLEFAYRQYYIRKHERG